MSSQLVVPEVIVESVHWQEVHVSQEHIRCVGVLQGHVPHQVDWVELALLVDDVVANVLAVLEDLGGLSIAQELLSLGVRHVERQADGALPVFTDGLQHLQPAAQIQSHVGEGSDHIMFAIK